MTASTFGYGTVIGPGPGLYIKNMRDFSASLNTPYLPGTGNVPYLCYMKNTNEIVQVANSCFYTFVADGLNISCGETSGITQIAIKSFIIDHPKKPDSYLVHGCLEGPEAGVYYRGTTQVCDKWIEVELPDYVDALAKDFTVNVTHIFDEETDSEPITYAATPIKNNKFRIYGKPGKVSWVVYGSRGNIEVEPLKSSVDVKGDGPYKWI